MQSFFDEQALAAGRQLRAGPYDQERRRRTEERPRNEKPFQITSRPHILVVSLCALIFVGVVLNLSLLFLAVYLTGGLALGLGLYRRYGLRALTIQRRLERTRAHVGETVDVTLDVENRKLLPLSWLDVQDEFPAGLPVIGRNLLPSHRVNRATLNTTYALWAFQRVRRRYRLVAIARGVYAFGPLALQTSDPFGLCTTSITSDMPATLLVHPLVVPIERFGLPNRTPFGMSASPQRLLEDPLRVSGVRDYRPGDEPRRIHWKATARIGHLQSKVYETSARQTVMVYLDVRTLRRAVQGYDEALAELAISAAASVIRWALGQGFAVGFATNSAISAVSAATSDQGADQQRTDEHQVSPYQQPQRIGRLSYWRVAPSVRHEQESRILDGLASLLPYTGVAMEDLLEDERRRLPAGTAAVYIGTKASVDLPVALALHRMQSSRHTISLLLTHPEPAGDNHGAVKDDEDEIRRMLAGLVIRDIGGPRLWTQLMRDALGSELTHLATSAVTPMATGTPLTFIGRDSSSAAPDAQSVERNSSSPMEAEINGTPVRTS